MQKSLETLNRAGVSMPKIKHNPNGNGVLRSHNKEDASNVTEKEIPNNSFNLMFQVNQS